VTYWAANPSGARFITIWGMLKNTKKLKNGNSLKAVLAFWNMNENK
jgi:hypothetical protein